MKKLEYIYSPENLLRESFRFRHFKVFQFEYFTKKLKTKKSISESEIIDFQQKILESKIAQNKRRYSGDVVLELTININQPNAPSIQNIPKCYIDLLWRPSEKLHKKSLILKDDDQIKYLKVNYRKSHSEKSSIFIKIFPYNRLLKDIELLFRIKEGTFKYEFKSIDLNFEEEHEEQYDENHMFGELVEHVRQKVNHIAISGEDDYLYWELFYKRIVQEKELNNQRIKNNQILDLFRKSFNFESSYMLESRSFPKFQSFERIFDMVFDILGDFQISELPKKSGDKKPFLVKLNKKVDEYFEKRWYYFPMLNPIALTIFILQPKDLNKDFDNLAKWIIPLYMKKLNPPTSLIYSLQAIEKHRLNKYSEKVPLVDLYSEFPKNGIMSYQIVQIPSTEATKEEGFIKVNFHNANFYQSFIDYIANQLSKHEDKLE